MLREAIKENDRICARGRFERAGESIDGGAAPLVAGLERFEFIPERAAPG
jgi:hypothetical protein